MLKRKETSMPYLMIRHKVADFAQWKPLYDAHHSARAAAGLSDRLILRGLDNPNEIVLLFEVADVNKARAFVTSPGLRVAMEKAGVVDRPDFHLLE
jgi:hypothetical protein